MSIMALKVKVKGPLRVVIGTEINVDLKEIEGNSVRDLVEFLKERYLDAAKSEHLEEVLNDFFSHNVVLVNGTEISAINGENTKLRDNDEIFIINITHGG